MRVAIIFAVCVLIGACSKIELSSPSNSESVVGPKDNTVVYVDMDDPNKLLKVFIPLPDPAYDATDASGCKKEHGVWADAYRLGVLTLEHPEEGAERIGKQCWSRRPLTRFPDAGKQCNGQADCVGNCIAQSTENGMSRPMCQVNQEDQVCGPVLYDGGRYHSITCPIP